MESQPERIPDDEQRVRAEERAAEADAGDIGGEGSGEDPVREGGGGEAEGFEDAEEKLIENAGHGEGNPLPDEFEDEAESDRSGADYGEADEESKPDQ
ncbi:MAG TPA: hypothetical protein VGF74_06360 [Thermoleophilaceae bacterium]